MNQPPDGTRLIALTIFAGFSLLAAAVFFGLRSQSPSAPGPIEESQGGWQLSEVEMQPGPAHIEADEVRRIAQLALETHRDIDLISACWRPMLERDADPDHSTFHVQSVFDASGREIARGISELRDYTSRADVAECLREFPPSLQIGAIGSIQTVDVVLTFGDVTEAHAVLNPQSEMD